MDMQQLTAAAASLKTAMDFGRAALELKNYNDMAAKVSDLNSKILDAQQSLFAHNVQLSELQEEHRTALRDLEAAKTALAERGRYLLHAVAPGRFAYRAEATATEPEHYICQPCFDGPDRRKAVLQDHPPTQRTAGYLLCPVCTVNVRYANSTGQGQRSVAGGRNSWMAR